MPLTSVKTITDQQRQKIISLMNQVTYTRAWAWVPCSKDSSLSMLIAQPVLFSCFSEEIMRQLWTDEVIVCSTIVSEFGEPAMVLKAVDMDKLQDVMKREQSRVRNLYIALTLLNNCFEKTMAMDNCPTWQFKDGLIFVAASEKKQTHDSILKALHGLEQHNIFTKCTPTKEGTTYTLYQVYPANLQQAIDSMQNSNPRRPSI